MQCWRQNLRERETREFRKRWYCLIYILVPLMVVVRNSKKEWVCDRKKDWHNILTDATGVIVIVWAVIVIEVELWVMIQFIAEYSHCILLPADCKDMEQRLLPSIIGVQINKNVLILFSFLLLFSANTQLYVPTRMKQTKMIILVLNPSHLYIIIH